MKPCLVLFALLLAFPTQAEIYKCRQPNGSTEISNSPCTKGSSTIKAIADDVVPEENRREAERQVARMRDEAEKLESARLADEAAEREKELKQRQLSGPPAAMIQECLRTIERLELDSARRTELEATCYSTGSVQPVYVPVPYYGSPTYVKPRPPIPTPLPLPKGEANPMPQPTPARGSSKVSPEYVPPSSFRPR
jgi:hypothetical protein